MAHSISVRKRIRQNAQQRLRNRSAKSSLRTAIKRFRKAVETGNAEAAAAAYRAVQKKADTIARKGIVHRKAAARIKSRLSHTLHKMSPAA